MSNIYVQEPPTDGKVQTPPWVMMSQFKFFHLL